jgi:hypothetical protein
MTSYYAEDLFHPTNTAEDLISVDSKKKRTNRALAKKMSGFDPNYYQINKIINVNVDGNIKRKRKTISFYGSTTHIRNAISGEFCEGYKVGSRYEDLYFKVGLCGGENGQTPVLLFYDSHKEWSNHMSENISDKDLEKWEIKNERMRNIVYRENNP